MIAFLRGRLAMTGAEAAVVDVGGVGYRVLIPDSTRRRLPGTGHEVQLFTSLQVREDAMTLYGFYSEEEYGLFELLLTVTQIGPKVALGVLSAISPTEFRRAVAFNDITALTRLPSIGKKTAQRLVLELKDKLGAVSPSAAVSLTAQAGAGPALPADAWDEAVEALVGLGYSRAEAMVGQERARPTQPETATTAELVRGALRQMARA